MVAAAWPTNTRAVRWYRKSLQGGRGEIYPGTGRPHVGQTPTGVSGLSANNPIRGSPHNFVRDSRPQAHNPDKNETALLRCAFRPLAGHGSARIKKTRKPKFHYPHHDAANRTKSAGAGGAKAEHGNYGVSTLFNCSWCGPSKTTDRQKHHMQGTIRILVVGFCSCMYPGQNTCATPSTFKRPQSVKFPVTTC